MKTKPKWLETIEEKVREKIDEISTREIEDFKAETNIEDFTIERIERKPFVSLKAEVTFKLYGMEKDIFVTNRNYGEHFGMEECGKCEDIDFFTDLERLIAEEMKNYFNGEIKVYRDKYGERYLVVEKEGISIRVARKFPRDC